MNVAERKAVVLAMELLARQINDEEVFDGWLMNGVADGDIPYGSTDINDVDDYYVTDNNFSEILGCFLRRMSAAKDSGGLYCDGILSKE